MDQQLKNLCIKVGKDSNLDECLVKYTKPRLNEILEIYNEKMPAAAKKQEMADRAEEVIKAHVIEYFAGEGADEKAFMLEICSNGLILTEADDLKKIETLYSRGFVFAVAEGDSAEVFVPENIKHILAAGDEKVEMVQTRDMPAEEIELKAADMNRTDQEAEVIKYAAALANIYGVYQANQLKAIWDYNHRTGISPSDVLKALGKAGSEDGFYISGSYIVNNLLPAVEDYFAVLDKLERSDTYFYPSEEVLVKYLDGPAYDDSAEYVFIRRFLERKLDRESDPEAAAAALTGKLFLLCTRDAAPNEIVDFFDKNGIEFADLEEFNRFIGLYTEWFYSIRVWTFKGYKPSELRSEKLQNTSFKLPSDVDPRKARKIGRNDKCPCGSGKKFKACCAKYINI